MDKGQGKRGTCVEGWKALLQGILDEHNHYYKDNGKARRAVSHKTRDDRAKSLFLCFRTLRDKLGYTIDNPTNLKPKHVEALVRYWESEGLSASTIQTRMEMEGSGGRPIGFPWLDRLFIDQDVNCYRRDVSDFERDPGGWDCVRVSYDGWVLEKT